MPDPVLYLQAMSAALGASVVIALALSRGRSPGDQRFNPASVIAVSVGILLGYLTLGMRPAWPPTNALGRWWLIIFPAVVAAELSAAIVTKPRWIAWGIRGLLAALMGRVLLHDSAYLRGPHSEWSVRVAAIILIGCAALLLVEWLLLLRLAQRSAWPSVLLGLATAIQTCGIAVMLAGYITGGAAAIPVAAAIGGVAVLGGVIRPTARMDGVLGIGLVGLFSLLFIGRFFGKLSTFAAVTIMVAPLLGWVSELPSLKGRNQWIVGGAQLAIVLIPLAVVLAVAKLKFDREILPLL